MNQGGTERNKGEGQQGRRAGGRAEWRARSGEGLSRAQVSLFDDDLLTQGSRPRAREWLGGWGPGAQRRGGGWKSMGSDVLLVCLTDDLEGSCSGIGYVCNRVPVQSRTVGHWADLPHRDLRGSALGEPFFKRCIITERDEGARALGRRGGGGGGGGGGSSPSPSVWSQR